MLNDSRLIMFVDNTHRRRTGSNKAGNLNRWYENPVVLLLYAFLAIAMTYPTVLFLRTKVMGGPEDNFHFLWELWYVAHALFDLHKSPFFDPDVFVPFGYSLIRNQDLSPGTVLLFSPLTHILGEVFTYNFLVLLSFPLTAFGTYLLARELWSNRLAAFLAGLIVGFCPYRFTHAAGHLSVVSTEWIPFFFLYLERMIAKPRAKNAVLAGIFFGLSSWSTWYYFFMVPIAAVFYLGFRIDWKAAREDVRHLLRLWAVFAGVALLFVLPLLIPSYLATRGAPVDLRGAGESQAFAAAIADYVIPPTTHFLWGEKVAALWRSGPNGLWQSEWQLYLGTVALLLAAVGVFHRRRRRVVVALSVMALGCLIFSFGPGIYFTHPPTLSVSTNDVPLSPVPAPGRFLRLLPGFNNLRGWSRLGFFVELAVGLLAAGGLSRILDWTKERLKAPKIVQVGVTALGSGLVLFDFFPREAYMSPVVPRAVDEWLSKQPGDFAFMEYPIPHHGFGGPAIYSTRLTGKKIIMGNAQNPPNFAYWSDLSAFPSPFTIDLLRGWGAKYVLVDESLYRAGNAFWNIYQTWDSLLSAIKQNPELKEVAVLDKVHVYEIVTGTYTDSAELLKNGSFEEGNARSLPGWKMTGKPTVDRTSKYSAGGRAGCRVSKKDFVSQPIPVKPEQCYRLTIRTKADAAPAALVMQLNWKDENDQAVGAPGRLRVRARPGRRWEHPALTVRAPAEAKSVVVQAKASDGNVWIDDYSLKIIPNECQPELFVTPKPLYAEDGQIVRAVVTWNTCCNSEGRVTLTQSDGAEEVLSTGPFGLAFLDGLKPGTQYELHLYSHQGEPALASTSVSPTKRIPTIAADPNPVPPGAGLGRTTISWTVLANGEGEICVSKDGQPEQVFAHGPSGSAHVDWIVPGSSYEFRLYSRDVPRRLLAKTVVK